MTASTLRQPAVRERLEQLGYLLKHTFSLVGRDPGILRPWIRMCIYAAVMVSLFFYGVISIWGNGSGILPLLLSLGMFLYKYFYYTRQELRQSWLTAGALQGEKRTAAEAKARVKILKSSARGIALVDVLLNGMLSWTLRSGRVGALLSLVLKGLNEVWDLVNHYLLPSVVVDGYGIRESVPQMGRLKESVPETLVGVFGIDIASRAVGTIMMPAYLLTLLVGLAVGIWVGDSLPSYALGDILQGSGLAGAGPLPETLYISVLPILVALWIAKLFSVVLERMTSSVKVIYFSIFYMRITHPDVIMDDIRDELEAYLRLEPRKPDSLASPEAQGEQ